MLRTENRTTDPPALEVCHVTKAFPAVMALQDVSITFHPGTVHGIVGENGAGKSTLMKVLAGINLPTSGELKMDGQSVQIRSVQDAEAAGIVMIHQELNLVDELTVAENIFLGRELRKGITLDRPEMERRASELLAQVRAEFGPRVKVASLSLASKQLVEIAKALSRKARILIMDEPTAVLSQREIEILFSLIQELKAGGTTVIYISHHLREIQALCDEVTVLRDGQVVGHLDRGEANPAELARRMVGRELGDFFPPKTSISDNTIALAVSGLVATPWVHKVSLNVRKGEIVGLAGLIGSGRSETAEAIMGLRPREAGETALEGVSVNIKRPQDAVHNGLAYVSEDRKGTGLHLTLNAIHNMTMANLKAYAHPIVSAKDERLTAESWVTKLDIRVGDLTAPVQTLSGGNQQKIAVAKWLDTQPKVLILDEPTRGVDVGAKREIYELIQSLAKQGLACLVIASEMTELIGLCHRILVLRSGRVAGELQEDQMTEENIMQLAAGIDTDAKEVA